jgi:hypothetical protein
MNKTPKHETHLEPAKRYVDQQLEIMKQKLSKKQYEVVVKKVARATAK